MTTFSVYLHSEVFSASKPLEEIAFIGHSVPYFQQVQQELRKKLSDHYPQLPLRKVDFQEFRQAHTSDYLEKILGKSKGEAVPIRWCGTNAGFEYFIPGYEFSLGGLYEAIDHMKRGVLDRAYCFVMSGHHAHPGWGHGYSILNSMAVAVRYAQTQGFNKVAIIDWDLHHGDGTQSIFEHDALVYQISVHHVADAHMATQRVLELGTTTYAEQVGHYNIPLLANYHEDSFLEEEGLTGKFYRSPESLTQFRQALETFPWRPDLIFIFAGVDSHLHDGGAGITDWDDQEYRQLTRWVLEVAGKNQCPVISVQGGGYTLEVTVSATIVHLDALAKA